MTRKTPEQLLCSFPGQLDWLPGMARQVIAEPVDLLLHRLPEQERPLADSTKNQTQICFKSSQTRWLKIMSLWKVQRLHKTAAQIVFIDAKKLLATQ